MAHFYLSDDLRHAEPGTTISVTGAEARHAVSVSRVRVGESLSIGDGAGRVAVGVVASVGPDLLALTVESVRDWPRPSPAIVLAQALAKGGRDESAVQAATELGVDRIVPWSAARSVVRWDSQKADKGRLRWESIVREATKQSMRAWVPEVSAVVATRELVELAGMMLVLVPGADVAIGEILSIVAARKEDGDREGEGDRDEDVVLVVGPEGGIAPEELALLVEAGATPVRLGAEVLRTSTAGPAALAVFNVTLGRWS